MGRVGGENQQRPETGKKGSRLEGPILGGNVAGLGPGKEASAEYGALGESLMYRTRGMRSLG